MPVSISRALKQAPGPPLPASSAISLHPQSNPLIARPIIQTKKLSHKNEDETELGIPSSVEKRQQEENGKGKKKNRNTGKS